MNYLISNYGILMGFLSVLLVTGYYLFAWYRVGKDPISEHDIEECSQPPEGLSPAAMRYVHQMHFDHRNFTAALINMAVKGSLQSGNTKQMTPTC